MKKSTTTKKPRKTHIDFARFFRNVRAYMTAGKYDFHAPRGNSKTGEIPAWNLLPGCTCTPEAQRHCMIEGCYAMKNAIRAGYDVEKSAVLKAWADNTVLARDHVDILEVKLSQYFSGISAPRFFRIHASGDFFSAEYGRVWYRIAKKHPETRFLAFTKAWNVAREVPFDTLPNFSLVLSGWTGVEIPEDLRSRYRCAWCDDGIETRIPADAIECPGNCDTCGICWTLRELGRDTYFHKH